MVARVETIMKQKKHISQRRSVKPKCGLCGKSRKLIKTECCDNWICDDEDTYVIFSYARNSCLRNHNHYTLCAHHHNEQHTGEWQQCIECKSDFNTEIYVWYGSSEYNFEKLPNPPAYEPTKCALCENTIVLSDGGFSMLGKQYFCEECTDKQMNERFKRPGVLGH